ncbi:unnamed protein product, partial [Prorocentrum cordatum]
EDLEALRKEEARLKKEIQGLKATVAEREATIAELQGRPVEQGSGEDPLKAAELMKFKLKYASIKQKYDELLQQHEELQQKVAKLTEKLKRTVGEEVVNETMAEIELEPVVMKRGYVKAWDRLYRDAQRRQQVAAANHSILMGQQPPPDAGPSPRPGSAGPQSATQSTPTLPSLQTLKSKQFGISALMGLGGGLRNPLGGLGGSLPVGLGGGRGGGASSDEEVRAAAGGPRAAAPGTDAAGRYVCPNCKQLIAVPAGAEFGQQQPAVSPQGVAKQFQRALQKRASEVVQRPGSAAAREVLQHQKRASGPAIFGAATSPTASLRLGTGDEGVQGRSLSKTSPTAPDAARRPGNLPALPVADVPAVPASDGKPQPTAPPDLSAALQRFKGSSFGRPESEKKAEKRSQSPKDNRSPRSQGPQRSDEFGAVGGPPVETAVQGQQQRGLGIASAVAAQLGPAGAVQQQGALGIASAVAAQLGPDGAVQARPQRPVARCAGMGGDCLAHLGLQAELRAGHEARSGFAEMSFGRAGGRAHCGRRGTSLWGTERARDALEQHEGAGGGMEEAALHAGPPSQAARPSSGAAALRQSGAGAAGPPPHGGPRPAPGPPGARPSGSPPRSTPPGAGRRSGAPEVLVAHEALADELRDPGVPEKAAMRNPLFQSSGWHLCLRTGSLKGAMSDGQSATIGLQRAALRGRRPNPAAPWTCRDEAFRGTGAHFAKRRGSVLAPREFNVEALSRILFAAAREDPASVIGSCE